MPRDNKYQKDAKNNVVELKPETAALKRPTAPKHLSDEERQIWKDTVAAKPIPYFGPDKLIMLEEFCRHKATILSTYKLRDLFHEYNKPVDIATDEKLLKQLNMFQLMISREKNAMTMLAKELGISARVEIVKENKKDDEDDSAPWEDS